MTELTYPPISDEVRDWITDNPNTSDMVDWVHEYAAAALALQAARHAEEIAAYEVTIGNLREQVEKLESALTIYDTAIDGQAKEIAELKEQRVPDGWTAQHTRTLRHGGIHLTEQEAKGWIHLQHQCSDSDTWHGPIPVYLAAPAPEPERYEQGVEDGKLIERGMARIRTAEAQQKRKPMTAQARINAFQSAPNPVSYEDFTDGIDAAEAHHGILPAPEDK